MAVQCVLFSPWRWFPATTCSQDTMSSIPLEHPPSTVSPRNIELFTLPQVKGVENPGHIQPPHEAVGHGKYSIRPLTLISPLFSLIPCLAGSIPQHPKIVPAEAESVEALDPFTIGRSKLAEFWPTYVKESDLYDKEMSEGWNKLRFLSSFIPCPHIHTPHSRMLDVILSKSYDFELMHHGLTSNIQSL